MVSRVQNRWRFTLIRPGARRVYLAGDFRRHAMTIQMVPTCPGVFQIDLDLAPGEYHFRYCADGQWLTDYAAFGVERRPDGEFDSILFVPDVLGSLPAVDRLNADRAWLGDQAAS